MYCVPQIDHVSAFTRYLAARDGRFALRAELWVCGDGSLPTRSWFLRRLQHLFPDNIAGHSLRSGGATALAECGTPQT